MWFSCWDQVIRLYLKISKKFKSFIFLDRFWFVHLPFNNRVKFQSLAQFPVNHLSYPIEFSLILFLCLFVPFDYYLIYRFYLSLYTPSTIRLRIIHFRFIFFIFGGLWHIDLCRLFNAKSIFIQINSSISNNSVSYKYCTLFIQLNVKTIKKFRLT